MYFVLHYCTVLLLFLNVVIVNVKMVVPTMPRILVVLVTYRRLDQFVTLSS